MASLQHHQGSTVETVYAKNEGDIFKCPFQFPYSSPRNLRTRPTKLRDREPSNTKSPPVKRSRSSSYGTEQQSSPGPSAPQPTTALEGSIPASTPSPTTALERSSTTAPEQPSTTIPSLERPLPPVFEQPPTNPPHCRIPNTSKNGVSPWLDSLDSDQESVEFDDLDNISAMESESGSGRLAPSTTTKQYYARRRLVENPTYRGDLFVNGIRLMTPGTYKSSPAHVDEVIARMLGSAPPEELLPEQLALHHEDLLRHLFSMDRKSESELSKVYGKLGLVPDCITAPLIATTDRPFAPKFVISNPRCPQVSLSIPKPDLIVGYNTEAILSLCSNIIWIMNERKDLMINNYSNHLPFFITEGKGFNCDFTVALNQLLGDSAAALKQNRYFVEGDSVILGLILTPVVAEFYITFYDKGNYITRLWGSFALNNLDHFRACRKVIANIFDWGVNDRFTQINTQLRRGSPPPDITLVEPQAPPMGPPPPPPPPPLDNLFVGTWPNLPAQVPIPYTRRPQGPPPEPEPEPEPGPGPQQEEHLPQGSPLRSQASRVPRARQPKKSSRGQPSGSGSGSVGSGSGSGSQASQTPRRYNLRH